jgi:class 3 adenylate cyclase/tetratricopeptide (TPR) repeat protein
MPEKTHRLAAIVFTDIVGYTRRMEENEQHTMQLLQRQREILFPLVKSYGGEVIKEIGDGLLMMFDSAVQAVRFAISVQQRLKDEELTIRAGIHIGDVIFKGGDVFGSAVNTAARIEPLAPPNGICISEDVCDQLKNKEEFQTFSLGKKELKGVSGSIEIFEVFIEGVSEKKKATLGSFFRLLWKRNVIQILAGYLIASWIIKQAVAAIVSRYLLSPYLIDLAWVLLLSLLPTVFLLAYFHGRRKKGSWTQVERFGLPINAVLSLLLLVLLFQGKDLGAATKQITLEDETGQKIIREIAKSEFRKDVGLFFFDNQSGDTSLDWLQYGFPTLLQTDLSQDIFIHIDPPYSYNAINKLRDAGYPDGLKAPLMLKKKIANELHKDYFISGSFNRQQNKWSLDLILYTTRSGKNLAEISLSDTNIFNLTDQASRSVKESLEIPEQHIAQTKDLAVSGVLTESFEALKNYIFGLKEIYLYNDFQQGIEFTEKAVEIDPDFATAHLTLAEYYFNNNQPQKAESSLKVTVDKDYKLLEWRRFYAKFFYYVSQQNADQAIAVVKMWSNLYPQDVLARIILAQRYLMKNDFRGAIDQYKSLIRMIPEEYDYVRSLGDIYERTGQYDSSLYYYQLYEKQHPEDILSYRNLGDTYQLLADFDGAIGYYNTALLIDPEDATTIVKLSVVKAKIGAFESAKELLLNALKNCKTAEDSMNLFVGLENITERTGEIIESFQYYQKKFEQYERILPPLRIMVFKTFMISKYIEVGREDEALEILQRIESEFQPPFDKVSAFGYLFYYTDMEQPQKAGEYIDVANQLIEGFGEQVLLLNIYYAEARIAEQLSNYKEAIVKYMEYQMLSPTDDNSFRWLARCHSQDGSMGKAVEMIQEALRLDPYDAKSHYEAARIYKKDGDIQKAREHINKALEIWKNADPVYKPAQKARSFQASLDTA